MDKNTENAQQSDVQKRNSAKALEPIYPEGKLISYKIEFPALFTGVLSTTQIEALTDGYISQEFIAFLEAPHYAIIDPIKGINKYNKYYNHARLVKMFFAKRIIENYLQSKGKPQLGGPDGKAIRKAVAKGMSVGEKEIIDSIIEELIMAHRELPFIDATKAIGPVQLKYIQQEQVEEVTYELPINDDTSEEETKDLSSTAFIVTSIEDLMSSELSPLDFLEEIGIMYDGRSEMLVAEAFLNLVRFYVNSGNSYPNDRNVNLAFILINDLFKRPVQSFRLTVKQRNALSGTASLWLKNFIPAILSGIDENTVVSEAQLFVIERLKEVAFPNSEDFRNISGVDPARLG